MAINLRHLSVQQVQAPVVNQGVVIYALDKVAESFSPNFGWTPDCQGKQDFDGSFIEVSCRYYPASYQANEWCSAIVALHVNSAATPWGYYVISRCEFEAPTEAEVKFEVERWVKQECQRILWSLVEKFQVVGESSTVFDKERKYTKE